MKYLLLLTALFSFSVIADTEIRIDDEISLADEAINAPTMNLEGQYYTKPEPVAAPAPVRVEKKKALSQSDRLKLLREKLEERNKIMVQRKMEQIRYKQELELARQLESSMNATLKSIDNIK